MKLLSRLVGRRSPTLGLVSDVAMVGAAAYRVARRPDGNGGPPKKKPGPLQWLVVAGAALRLLGRIRRVRRNRRAAAAS